MFTQQKLIYLIWGMFFGYWFLAYLSNRFIAEIKEPVVSRLLSLLLLGMGILLIGFDPLILGPLLRRLWPERVEIAIVGFVMMILGLGFAVWACLYLGKKEWLHQQMRKNHMTWEEIQDQAEEIARLNEEKKLEKEKKEAENESK